MSQLSRKAVAYNMLPSLSQTIYECDRACKTHGHVLYIAAAVG